MVANQGGWMMQSPAKFWLMIGGCLSMAIAVLHIGIAASGAPAYRYFGAGEEMARLAESGSGLPALITLMLAAIFALCGLYAFSGAGLVRRLPLLRLGLLAMGGVYTLRGMGVIAQIASLAAGNQSVAAREIVFSLTSLLTGIAYLAGMAFMGIAGERAATPK
jgi:hypothetical protein